MQIPFTGDVQGRAFHALVAAGVIGCSWIAGAGDRAWAQSPEATPTPPPTPLVERLPRPKNVRYLARPDGSFITWQDNATDEDGYRLEVTIREETRIFETVPDVEQLRLPDGFDRGCGTIRVAVRAYKGSEESEPGFDGLARDFCGPGPVTPTAATSTLAPPGLPDAGAGSSDSRSGPVYLVLLGVGGLAAIAAGLAFLVVRLRR